MARLAPVVLLSLLLASAFSAAPEVCGAPGTEAGACEDEDSSVLQMNFEQSQHASSAAGGGGIFDYKSFHIGDWPAINAQCAGGSTTGFQAPINIAVHGAHYETMPRKSWPKFYARDGGCEEAYFVAKGTAWQVDFMKPEINLDCKNLEMEWNGKVYALVQFHFHTLSEDTVDFQPTAMQMHMVHLAADGSVAVVGVLIKTDGFYKNPFLKGIFGAGFDSDRPVTLPGKQRFNPYKGVLKKSGEFWHYAGSFTTPPCTEGVDFLIAQTPVIISACHVKSYMQYLQGTGSGNSYGQNHRPIQPLKDRVITTGRFLEVCPSGSVPDVGHLDPRQVKICEGEA